MPGLYFIPRLRVVPAHADLPGVTVFFNFEIIIYVAPHGPVHCPRPTQ